MVSTPESSDSGEDVHNDRDQYAPLDDLVHHDAPEQPPVTGRSKAAASVADFSPGHLLRKLSDPLSTAVQELIIDVRAHYAIPDGSPNPGVVSGQGRAALKHRADQISRSQYEVYAFSTKYDLPEAAVDELLRMLSNVSNLTSTLLACIERNISQERFRPEGIQHKTMKSMDRAARLAMMSEYEMLCVDLKEGMRLFANAPVQIAAVFVALQCIMVLICINLNELLVISTNYMLPWSELDGGNSLKFFYIDLVEAVKRMIENPEYDDKLYDSFQLTLDEEGNRVFDKVNTGLVFESFQLLDPHLRLYL